MRLLLVEVSLRVIKEPVSGPRSLRLGSWCRAVLFGPQQSVLLCYEPVVLFYGPNPYRERFQALGVQVMTLNEQPPIVAPAAGPQRDIAASLSRYGNWLATGYRDAKQVYLLAHCDWPLARRLARLIKDEAIDLVHSNSGLDRAAIMAARLVGVPCVCHVRMWKELSFVDRCLARFVNSFVYISKAVEQCYRSHGIHSSRGKLIYNPIDVEAFVQADNGAELRAEFGLTDQNWLISNVGRLDWWKGHDYFLRAMAK